MPILPQARAKSKMVISFFKESFHCLELPSDCILLANVNRAEMGDTGPGSWLRLIRNHSIVANLKQLLSSEPSPQYLGWGDGCLWGRTCSSQGYLSVEVAGTGDLEKDVGEQALQGVLKIKLKHVTQLGHPSQEPSKQLEPRNWTKMRTFEYPGKSVGWGLGKFYWDAMALPTGGFLYMFGKHCVDKLCSFKNAGWMDHDGLEKNACKWQ